MTPAPKDYTPAEVLEMSSAIWHDDFSRNELAGMLDAFYDLLAQPGTDADHLMAMLVKTGVKYRLDSNQSLIGSPAGSFIISLTEFTNRTMHVVFDFDPDGNLKNIEICE